MESLADMGAVMFVVVGSGLGDDGAMRFLMGVDGPRAEFFGVDIGEAPGGYHRGQNSRLVFHDVGVLPMAKEGLPAR